MTELTPQLTAGIAFAYIGGFAFVTLGVYRSIRKRRLDPLLLVCISAISISWIEAPYDWAMYAQFPPALPRMPSWWPLNMTWGGLPSSVPPGYIAYFVLPSVVAAFVGRQLSQRLHWRRPLALLGAGLTVGFVWALLFNGFFASMLGITYYGRVIGGLAIREGTKLQYPLYDSLAMGVLVMVFAYLIGRTDAQGRTIVDQWAESRSTGRLQSALLSVLAFVVIGHGVYGAVFAPHLVTKLTGLVNIGPTEQLFEGVPNQPQ